MNKLPIRSRAAKMAFVATCATSIVASISLAAISYVHVPLSVDGTWYSYPAYAWSQGGDPSENIPGVARPSPAPDRALAKFGWENRTNLTVLLTAGWFKAFAPSWVSLKALGATQLILLAVLIGTAVWRLTANPMLGLFAGCLVASDARVIREAMSDARPDLFIAVFGAALLCLLIDAFRSLKPGSIVAAAALAVTLPLLHVTAANAIAFFLAFLACCAVLGRDLAKANHRIRIGLLIAALLVGSFFLKQSILNVLIPTNVSVGLEDQFRHHLDEELHNIIRLGVPAKLAIELSRWTHYFFRANTIHLIFVLIALIVAAKVFRKRQHDLTTTIGLSLVAGFFGAAFAMLLTDSHALWEHALVVAVLGYSGCIAVVGVAERASILATTRLTQICCGTLALGALLNFAAAYALYRQYNSFQLSNPAEEAFLLNALPQHGDVKIIGPTELWPYLVQRKQPLLLIDTERTVFRDKGDMFDAVIRGPHFAGASYLILNNEYYDAWRWGAAAAEWSRKGLISGLKQLGDCDRAVQCLRIYSLASSNGN